MLVEKLSNSVAIEEYLKELDVDSGGVKILSDKSEMHLISIQNLAVGGANILKQDALSVGADLAVPRGTVVAKEPFVDCLLIATTAHLKRLAKKELVQPFGLKDLAQKLKSYTEKVPQRDVQIMGILNANDDSFYAQSRFSSKNALEKIEQMIEEGATIIDIGGVSSAPNAELVSEAEELARVKDIIDLIVEQKLTKKARFSIDSYAPRVVEYALQAGFSIVNDITGLADERICELCVKYNATAIIMHMQGNPQTMQKNPHYESLLSDIYTFFQERIEKAERFGIKDIILDVGIGFGKSLEDNLMLIKHLEHFLSLKKELLVGASRKSLIGKIDDSKTEERLGGTLALHLEAIRNGATLLRVHDVAEHLQAVRVAKALT